MANIGGNITATIYRKTDGAQNEIGEAVNTWQQFKTITGWHGLQSGDSRYTVYNAKIQEATHVFLCDFAADVYALAAEDLRLQVGGLMYDVKFVDNPDEMNEQLEIYLTRTGA